MKKDHVNRHRSYLLTQKCQIDHDRSQFVPIVNGIVEDECDHEASQRPHRQGHKGGLK